MSETDSSLVQRHYGRSDLTRRILDALTQAGKNVEALTREDLAPFEEFHIRGRDATRELAQLAELGSGMHVLDVGCGIGGPARTLAAEFGCRVTGMDLVPSFRETAEELTRRVGLADRVALRQGDAMNMPFGDGEFDAAMHEHITMNIREKDRLFREIARVLRPRGRLALYEICAGDASPPHFPVPWANEPSISFLASPDLLKAAVESAGFDPIEWRDVTAVSLDWCRAMAAGMANRPAGGPPPLGPGLIMGPDAPAKLGNIIRNLEEDRIRVVQGAFERT